jgi:hypothetical protein
MSLKYGSDQDQQSGQFIDPGSMVVKHSDKQIFDDLEVYMLRFGCDKWHVVVLSIVYTTGFENDQPC